MRFPPGFGSVSSMTRRSTFTEHQGGTPSALRDCSRHAQHSRPSRAKRRAWFASRFRKRRTEQLARVHTSDYISELAALRGQEGDFDADTYLSPGSVTAAMRAAGGACNLVDALLDGSVERAVALLRPPGHHARPHTAMGFCLLNNVAVAAAHARARGIERVLVVDWDVHHGNGTQEMFFRDPNVLYVSTHQWPFYPGSGATEEVGEGDGRGFTLNVPLSAGAGDAEYAAAFERVDLARRGFVRPEPRARVRGIRRPSEGPAREHATGIGIVCTAHGDARRHGCAARRQSHGARARRRLRPRRARDQPARFLAEPDRRWPCSRPGATWRPHSRVRRAARRVPSSSVKSTRAAKSAAGFWPSCFSG